MDNREQITTSAGLDHHLDETRSDPLADFVTDVAGGPDGAVLGIS